MWSLKTFGLWLTIAALSIAIMFATAALAQERFLIPPIGTTSYTLTVQQSPSPAADKVCVTPLGEDPATSPETTCVPAAPGATVTIVVRGPAPGKGDIGWAVYALRSDRDLYSAPAEVKALLLDLTAPRVIEKP